MVKLTHAGDAAALAISSFENNVHGKVEPLHSEISVPDLASKIQSYHDSYVAGVYPELSDPFEIALFNTYRDATYPLGWPRPLKLHEDERGSLFEAVKGKGGGQTFLSTTKPGITRGNHFHLSKVERFLVIQGDAVIRIRKVLTDDCWEYPVSGASPAIVDMPTLWTHSIENVGASPLITLFWTNDIFDPQNPDTFADEVVTS